MSRAFPAEKVVVTQPAAGEFKVFSAVCSHLQYVLDQVADGTIDCPCHGSQFSVKNSSVVAGRRRARCPAQSITLADGRSRWADPRLAVSVLATLPSVGR